MQIGQQSTHAHHKVQPSSNVRSFGLRSMRSETMQHNVLPERLSRFIPGRLAHRLASSTPSQVERPFVLPWICRKESGPTHLYCRADSPDSMQQHACGSGCGHSHDGNSHSHHSQGRNRRSKPGKVGSKGQTDQERMELEERQALGK